MTTEERSLTQCAARSAGLRWVAGIVGVLVMGAAIGLWGRHGAAVFFDMVAAGVAYCF